MSGAREGQGEMNGREEEGKKGGRRGGKILLPLACPPFANTEISGSCVCVIVTERKKEVDACLHAFIHLCVCVCAWL